MEASEDLRRSLASLEPNYPVYQSLKEALARYRALARDDSLRPVPVVRVVRPGERYAGLDDLRRLLVALGDLVPKQQASTGVYEEEMVEAVKRFQWRHALDTDGIIGGQTFRALNTPLSRRVRQLELTLERLRWLPHRADRMSLVVNIPAFRLNALDPDEDDPLRLWMRVVVGKAIDKRQTPVFSDRMRYIIFRPYWNVPYSIAVRSVVPALEKDPSYLATNHYEITASYGDDPGLKTYPPTPENIAKLRSGSLVLRQKPGPHNALGLAKFIFPNAKAVYLHGTPARELFARSRRDFSSGCIRVEDPAALAELLLEKEEGWDRERIARAMEGPRPSRVNLSEPIPVFLLYATAVVDLGGTVFFFDDLYGHDERLEAVLEAGYPYP
jgi:murein L,D-transpeptidase YcbB/YkuD